MIAVTLILPNGQYPNRESRGIHSYPFQIFRLTFLSDEALLFMELGDTDPMAVSMNSNSSVPHCQRTKSGGCTAMASPKSMFLLVAMFSASLIPVARADDKLAERAFTLKVLPVLKAKCFACHGEGEKKPKGGLDMRSLGALIEGGDTDTALKPGKPAESLLFKAINWDEIEMPPKENDRLTAAQIKVVEEWIRAGAPWPDDATQKKYRDEERTAPLTADGMLVKTSGGLSDEWTYRRYNPADVWAFQPVKKPTLPANVANPVDHFLQKKAAEAGVSLAPQADPRTLIRRATFDLIGLPPTTEETETFLGEWKADSTKAWETLIDRLLASPHYGERWAQHWFDVTRYADTGGMANDYERSNMWRYRDYVIRSFNEDKPYDRFVVEQIAGDEMADASALKRLNGNAAKLAALRASGDYTEEEAESIVATSFLRMGPWDNAMIKDEQARQIYLDDVVNSVGQTFLATTMRCFKCHDHKFDPLPTRDYYRVYAAFAGTQMAERPLRFLEEETLNASRKARHLSERWPPMQRVSGRRLRPSKMPPLGNGTKNTTYPTKTSRIVRKMPTIRSRHATSAWTTLKRVN